MRNTILKPAETLKDAIHYAENIKVAYDLLEEKSPKENKTLVYLLGTLNVDITALLDVLYGAMKSARGDSDFAGVDCEIIVDEKSGAESEKVI